jgi:hypothetical protein
MATYNVYSDPSHSWVRVPRDVLNKLNISEFITSFSYQRGEHVYLEEDFDLSTFVDACKRNNKEVKFRYFDSLKSSKIRSYASYTI